MTEFNARLNKEMTLKNTDSQTSTSRSSYKNSLTHTIEHSSVISVEVISRNVLAIPTWEETLVISVHKEIVQRSHQSIIDFYYISLPRGSLENSSKFSNRK